ncbi:eukaryotic translation initiation factor 2 alpha kinase 2 [Turdus rufiventris]|nr:eukaryotic translation initiation factor 2 alpha kinase 2 [Turdus rufiventris]
MDCDYMGRINRYRQINKVMVDYDINETGPPHDPVFTVVIKINGEAYGTGTGKSKKEAKAVAAKETCKIIDKQQEGASNMAATEIRTTQPTSSPPLDKDYVSLLNTYSQRSRQMIDYTNVARDGDPHAPMYTVFCKISGCVYGRGTGPSLIVAKQAAAKEAFEKVETERSNGNCTSDSKILAANFANVRNKEEEKNMSDVNGSLPDMDANTGEENGSPHTVNKTFLDLFEEIEPIDKGGFGTVFKATLKSDKTTYAIKRVKFTEKVEREAKGLAMLTHENIVRYHCSWTGYDCIKDPGLSWTSGKKVLCLFIQMEFCEKGTLENWIAKNREDQEYHAKAQNKFLQIVKGVEYIHSKDLIHRDLKSGDKYGKEVDIYALGLIWYEILSAITGHERSKVGKLCGWKVLGWSSVAPLDEKEFHLMEHDDEL